MRKGHSCRLHKSTEKQCNRRDGSFFALQWDLIRPAKAVTTLWLVATLAEENKHVPLQKFLGGSKLSKRAECPIQQGYHGDGNPETLLQLLSKSSDWVDFSTPLCYNKTIIKLRRDAVDSVFVAGDRTGSRRGVSLVCAAGG